MSRRTLHAVSTSLILIAGCGRSQAAPNATPSSTTAATTPPKVDDLDALLEPIRKANDLPALTAAVFDEHALLAIGAVGVRKLGDPTKVTKTDEWHLGSDSKAMTATLTALLVKEGVVKWSTTMAEAFPEWAITMDPGYKTVTLEMLLGHRGGAPADVPADIWAEMWKPGVTEKQRLAAVKAMLSRAPETPPGTKFVYANAGYMMVGAALEHATGKSWETMMSNRVFAKLGMTSCGYGSAGTPGKTDEPWGHELKGTKLVPISPGPQGDNPPSLGPAGTVHCGLEDWGKFLQAHLLGENGDKTILPPASFTKLHTPAPGGDYALGWLVTTRPWAGGKALTHSGSNTMNYATVWIAPAKHRILVVATNRGDDAAAKAVDDTFGPLIKKYVK